MNFFYKMIQKTSISFDSDKCSFECLMKANLEKLFALFFPSGPFNPSSTQNMIGVRYDLRFRISACSFVTQTSRVRLKENG